MEAKDDSKLIQLMEKLPVIPKASKGRKNTSCKGVSS